VIVERFEGRPSLELTGFSVSVFDADANLWRQTWAPAWEIAYARAP
jgi:hypothetical protein